MKLNIRRFAVSVSISAYETGVDIVNNVSYITGTIKITTSGSSYNNEGSAYYTINGGGANKFSIGKATSKSFAFTLGPYYHNQDGSLGPQNVSVYVKLTSSTNTSGSVSVPMSTIPRSSSISGGSGTIESATTIYLGIKAAGFTHNVYADFGGIRTNIIFNTQASAISWTIPATFYSQIPNSTIGTGVLYVDTYNGGTYIGTQACSFNASTSASRCKPTITGTAIDVNEETIALTGSELSFVSGYSNAKITRSASAKNYASIRSVTVNGVTMSGNELIINKIPITTKSFVLKVTDSRGYSSEYTIPDLTFVNYIPVSISATADRINQTSSTVRSSYSGNYFNSGFGAVDNELKVVGEYKIKSSDEWTEFTTDPVISDNTYSESSFDIDATLIYTNTYDIRYTVSDKLSSQIIQLSIQRGVPNFAVFEDDITINGEKITDKIKPTLLDMFYPVGSIYMSLSATDPSILFGGTWERIRNRFLVGADSASGLPLGSYGGSTITQYHALTVEQIPPHAHQYFRQRALKEEAIQPDSGTTFGVTSTASNTKSQPWTYNTGGGQGHAHGQNYPPYLAVYMWRRTA